MSDRPNVVKMSTPVGVSKYPKLTTPDYGTKDFPKPDGEYSTRLIFNGSDPRFVAFRERLEPYMARVEKLGLEKFAALKKAQRDQLGAPKKNLLFTPVYDEEEEPTGEFEMKFTMKAGGVIQKGPRKGKTWSRKPALFDAFGRKITKPVEIWGGSELIVSFTFVEDGYFIAGQGAYGIKPQLEAVQIVTLRAGAERSASDYGFSVQEGGFDASQLADKDDDYDAEDEDDYGSDSDGDDHAADPQGASDF